MNILSRRNFWIPIFSIIAVLVGLSYLLLYTYNEAKELVEKEFYKQQLLLAKQTVVGIEDNIHSLFQETTELAEREAIRNFDRKNSNRIFTGKFDHVKGSHVSDILVVNAQGKIWLSYPDPISDSNPQWIQDYFPIIQNSDYSKSIHDFVFTPRGKKEKRFAIFSPIFNRDNEFQGAVVFIIRLVDLFRGHLPSHIDDRICWLMNINGEVICPYKRQREQLTEGNPIERDSLKKFLGRMDTHKPNQCDYVCSNGARRIIVTYPIDLPSQDWALIIASSEQAVNHVLRSFTTKYLLTSLIFLLILSVIAIKYIRDLIAKKRELESKYHSQQEALQKSEEKVKESETNYRKLFDHSNEAIYLWRIEEKDGKQIRLLDVNQVAIDMLGYSKKELLQMDPNAFFDQESRKKIPEIIDELLEKEQNTCEMVQLCKDGSKIPVELFSHVFLYNGKKVVLSSIRDITRRKQTEEELTNYRNHLEELVKKRTLELTTSNARLQKEIAERKAAEEKIRNQHEFLNKVIDSLPHPFYVVDVNTYKIKIANSSARQKGVQKDSICYKTLHHSDSPCKLPVHPCPLGNVVKSGKPEVVEHVHYDESGELRNIEVHGYPVFDKAGKVVQMITYSLDVTERKKNEERLKALIKEKDILLSEIHHRVKNNLQVMYSLLNIQAEYLSDKKDKEIFKSYENQLMSMALIHDNLYRLNSLSDIDVIDYFQNLADVILQSYNVDSRKIQLKLEIDDIKLGIDTAIQCGLIVNELMSNAIKHAFPNGEKGEVKLIFHKLMENTFELIVADNGIGLPSSLDLTKNKTFGLEMVTFLVENSLHGKITFDNNGGKGAEFRIRFELQN
ncbi:MAG: PAS domain S-box protein [Calditrichaeota bacterium]|nr:PAS domain S-box protein [Calditrichota bacterium]